jgi:hypothetical protein
MTRAKALKLLKSGPKGIQEWNGWRRNGKEIPSLKQADLHGANLRGAVLSRADLRGAFLIETVLAEADLSGAVLSWARLDSADLSGAVLSWADLSRADLGGADLTGADLRGAYLDWAFLNWANLTGAALTGAALVGADLTGTLLAGADLTGAVVYGTNFGDIDLSEVKGLETIRHVRPSTVGVDTLIRSKGTIPEAFLRGCGVPYVWINHIPDLIGAMQPIQFYSCFISYSHKDEEFAKRLHGRMAQEKLRVWYAPEDMQGGKWVDEQLERAIQVHDRLLLVLSENSLGSKWVEMEILRARAVERRESRKKLFPIRLVDMEVIKAWRRGDPDTGEDLGQEMRRYHIPDFTNWKDQDAFEAAFGRLLRDLKAEGPPAK